MATPAAMSSTLLALVLVAFGISGSRAATFTITNGCAFTVFPAAITDSAGGGGGTELKPGETWTVAVVSNAGSGRIWARTGCSFDLVTGHGGCNTGDCGGTLRLVVSGKPPATLAKFTVDGGDLDSYGIYVSNGFNIPMDFSCSTGEDVIRCRDPGCPDDGKYKACMGDSDYEVVFCPST